MKKRSKRFSLSCSVPTQPVLVLSTRMETPWEIAARTGLDIRKLDEPLKRWACEGLIAYGELRASGCVVPMFRMRSVFDRIDNNGSV
jgi:hypothetical protein